jgi:hypothetical protein
MLRASDLEAGASELLSVAAATTRKKAGETASTGLFLFIDPFLYKRISSDYLLTHPSPRL